MKRTIGQIKQGLEGLAKQYRLAKGDLTRARINSSARSYLERNVTDNVLISYLTKLYESWKVIPSDVEEPVEFRE